MNKVEFIFNEEWKKPIQDLVAIFKDGSDEPLTHEEITELVNFIKVQLVISELKRGDLLLIAGKGHEKFQSIMGKKFPFDDVKIAEKYSGAESPS